MIWAQGKPRARELGVRVGALEAGRHNAITDVAGVAVGHSTLRAEGKFATGVTVVLPHGGNVFHRKVPAAIEVFNGFGKLVGFTQVRELGELESPVALTSTLNIHRVADGLLDYMLALPGNESVRSLNVVVGETNDSRLNAIRERPIASTHVRDAIAVATGGPVTEGAVGAGTGTVCFGFKGGIGSSSRVTATGHTVGVLVQTNFGGRLHIAGVPVGDILKATQANSGDGSLMIVVATDAPLDSRSLGRLARRAFLGMARTGGNGANGSGDYSIAFSTAPSTSLATNDALTPLFDAVADATEEAIYNSMFAAETVTSNGATVEALPVARVVEILRERGAIR
ncbi:MAG: P1 family peptidase [Bryobacterales bacterium]|nr:P1 family peptidase [Bryobacterales bacterium]